MQKNDKPRTSIITAQILYLQSYFYFILLPLQYDMIICDKLSVKKV